MKLNEIRTFIAVADARSVQEAGNRLGLTQSAVSRLIQRLEAELGVVLFDTANRVLRQFDSRDFFRLQRRRQLRRGFESPLRFGQGVFLPILIIVSA